MNVKKRSLLDTNVLVYQFDRTNLTKQSTAQNLIKELIRENKVVISSQVVQEFISVALNKFETQIPAQEVQYIIDNLLMTLCAHVPSIDFYKRAVSLFSSNNLNFYDALIIQAAIDLGCDILFSEDLQDGQLFGNLQVINPFK